MTVNSLPLVNAPLFIRGGVLTVPMKRRGETPDPMKGTSLNTRSRSTRNLTTGKDCPRLVIGRAASSEGAGLGNGASGSRPSPKDRWPSEVFEAITDLMADALVEDFQRHRAATVRSPQGADHRNPLTNLEEPIK